MNCYRCLFSIVVSMLAVNVTLAQQAFEPLPEHKVIQQDVGTWDAKGKMWMPGTPEPSEFSGTEVNRSLGGMWIVSDFEGSFFGQSFVGHSTLGYDMDAKKYVGSWMDSVSPYSSSMSGTYDPKTKTMTMDSTTVDPATGKLTKGKNVIVYKDANTREMTMYIQDPETPGEMTKSMVIVYTRRKTKGSGAESK